MKGWRYFTTIFGDQSIHSSSARFEPMACDDLPGEDVSLLKNSIITNPHDQRNTKRFSKLSEMIDNDDVVVTQSEKSNQSSTDSFSIFSSFPSPPPHSNVPEYPQNCLRDFCSDDESVFSCTCELHEDVETDGKSSLINQSENQQNLRSSSKIKSNGFSDEFSSTPPRIKLLSHAGCEKLKSPPRANLLSNTGSDGLKRSPPRGNLLSNIVYDDEDKIDCDYDEFQEVMRPLCPSENSALTNSRNISRPISWPKHSFTIRPPTICKSQSSAEKNLIDFDS